jgi:hypothetical protein
LNREIFGHHPEAKVLGEQYRQECNTERPHGAPAQCARLPDPGGVRRVTGGSFRSHCGTNLTLTLVQRSGAAQPRLKSWVITKVVSLQHVSYVIAITVCERNGIPDR